MRALKKDRLPVSLVILLLSSSCSAERKRTELKTVEDWLRQRGLSEAFVHLKQWGVENMEHIDDIPKEEIGLFERSFVRSPFSISVQFAYFPRMASIDHIR